MRIGLCATAPVFVVASLALACGDRSNGRAPEPASPATTTTTSTGTEAGSPGAPSEPPAPTRVALADQPSIDLIANRYRWHTYRAGLVMPFGGEGFRKYVNEYSDPWGAVVDHDGRKGRALGGRRAILRFPAEQSGAATLWLRMHGVAAGQRLTVTINDKRVTTATPAAAWGVTAIAVPAKVLREGENTLRLELRSRGTIAGTRAYALVHSIEVAGADAVAPEQWPGLSPVFGGPNELAGFPRLAMPIEIPPSAWLEVSTRAAGGTAFRVTAKKVDGTSVTLFEHAGKLGAQDAHQISLADLGGQLVQLELHADGDGGWVSPRIALTETPVHKAPAPVDNVVLVVVDALRSDRLALYGDTRVKTPRVTALANERGVVYLHNQAASPSSPPSHGSIQTGMIPRVHGVAGDKNQLIPGTPMISTVLGDAGIATLYTGNNSFGMGRLEKPGKWTEYRQPNREGLGIDCKPLIEQILQFAGEQKKAGKRFFVSSLPYETHVPYRFHEGITDKYYEGPWDKPIGKSVGGVQLGQITGGALSMNEHRWNQVFALYDGEAERMDGCFGQLFDGLETLGLTETTAVVITSDHGEGMYEHKRMGHAFGHWFELGNVPFIVISPGLVESGTKVDVVTSHIDIAPTIVDLMGVAAEPRMQGTSVLPLALRDGTWVPRVMSLEYGRSFALRAQGWRYIVDYTGGESLYDVVDDPTEQINLVGKSPLALRYFRDLTGFFLAHRTKWHVTQWGTLNDHSAQFASDVSAATGGKK